MNDAKIILFFEKRATFLLKSLKIYVSHDNCIKNDVNPIVCIGDAIWCYIFANFLPV